METVDLGDGASPHEEKCLTLVGLGEILWDVMPDGKRLGGAPANFAYHAQALGCRGVIISAVGEDSPGREILSQLRCWGLCCDYISIDAAHPTGVVTVSLDGMGQPRYHIHTDVAWDFIRWSPGLERAVQGADAICFGTLCQRTPVSAGTIRCLVTRCPAACLRVLDLNLRQHYWDLQTIEALLDVTDVLKLNDEELSVLAQPLQLLDEPARALRQLNSRYRLRLTALTRGGAGSLLCSGGETSEHPGFVVNVVDTVGAGDAFTAALITGFLRGHDLDRLNEDANRVASSVCTRAGATAGTPIQMISRGPERMC